MGIGNVSLYKGKINSTQNQPKQVVAVKSTNLYLTCRIQKNMLNVF